MNVEIVELPLTKIEADFTITLITPEQFGSHPQKATLELAGFEPKAGSSCTLHETREMIIAVEAFDADTVRTAAAGAIRTLSGFKYESVKISQYGAKNVQALTEGLVLGSYRFERYKSDSKPTALKNVYLSCDNHDGSSDDYAALVKSCGRGKIIAQATNFTRDLVNTTPDDMTPADLAIVAESLSKANDLLCDIYDVNALMEEEMNAMLSVARASTHPPRLIHLAYKPENPVAVVSLVGKGLTYDSGGLSLKPSANMVTMKMDKAGGCAVLGMLKAVSELKLPVEVHGFVGAVENMIGGNAYKPDDVLVAKNGKTIEVRNTDAEGRLVLADVFGFAQDRVKADYLFDFATLTGACMVALGEFTTGIMGHSDELKARVGEAANSAGELVGPLPFNDHLKKLIKSEIADVSNLASKPYGGAITAALFLDHFIDDDMKEQWMHFDIAGSAYTESGWGVNPHGGTGAGVRTAVAFLRSLGE